MSSPMCKLSCDTWNSEILTELHQLQKANVMCNVRLELAGGDEIPAHGCVLAAASPFLRSLLPESESLVKVNMSAFSSEIVKQVIHFIYTGEAVISRSDLLSLNNLTVMLNISGLSRVAEAMLSKSENIQTCGDGECDILTLDGIPSPGPLSPSGLTLLNSKSNSLNNVHQLIEASTNSMDVSSVTSQPADNVSCVDRDSNSLNPHALNSCSRVHELVDNAGKILATLAGGFSQADDRLHEVTEQELTEIDHVISRHIADDTSSRTSSELREPETETKLLQPQSGLHMKGPRSLNYRKVKDKPVSVEIMMDRAAQTLPDILDLHQSMISPMEKGVFTKVPLQKGCLFGPYQGQIMDTCKENTKYTWAIYKNCKLLCYIDGEDESKANWMRYVRDQLANYNLEALQTEGLLYFRVHKPVPSGQELTIGSLFRNKEDIFKKMKNELVNDVSTTRRMLEKNEGTITYLLCSRCNSVYTTHKSYYSHMHSVHGQLTPLDRCMNTDDEIDEMSSAVQVCGNGIEIYGMDGKETTGTCGIVKSADNEQFRGNDVPVKEVISSETLSFRCDECEREYCDELLYYRHRLMAHGKPLPLNIYKAVQSSKKSPMIHCGIKGKYKCSECDKLFVSQFKLNEHSRCHTGEKAFDCEICGKGFVHRGSYKKHLVTHTGRTHTCTVCNKSFTLKHHLTRHMTTHKPSAIGSNVGNMNEEEVDVSVMDIVSKQMGHDDLAMSSVENEDIVFITESSHLCFHCGQSFARQDSLKRHMLRHTNFHPYKCNKCPKTFKDSSSLQVHLRSHSGIRPYKCSQCDCRFMYSGLLRSHQLRHAKKKPFKCSICQKSFLQKQCLNQHIRTMHMQEKQPECGQCKKKFSSTGNLEQHQTTTTVDGTLACLEKRQLVTKTKKYRCTQCDYVCEWKYQLRNHRLSHIDITPHRCQHCPKSFKRRFSLRDHVDAIHRKVTRYPCHICHEVFTKRHLLRQHGKIHKKSYQCPMCDKDFSQGSSLRTHLVSHTGELPYKCTLCDRAYRQKVGLRDHMNVHTGERPHQCHICQKAFPYAGSLRKHMTVHDRPDSETHRI